MYKMELFIAKHKINKFMKNLDLKPDHKCFIDNIQTVLFKPAIKIDANYFFNIIKKSRDDKDFWVPAIKFNGKLYVSPEIKEISDGTNIMFISNKGRE